jgi:hypothetical protein
LESTAEANNDIQRLSSSNESNAPIEDLIDMISRISLVPDLSSELGLDGELHETCEDLINLDKDEPCGSSHVDHDDIVKEALEQYGIHISDGASDADCDDEPIELIPEKDVIESIVLLRTYLSNCNSGTDLESYISRNNVLDHLSQTQKHVLKEQKRKQIESLVQPTITSFFLKKTPATSSASGSPPTKTIGTAMPNIQTDTSARSLEVPDTWEEMDQIYLGYNCEGHGKGAPRTKDSLTKCLEHLRAWVKHVGSATNGVAIAKMHIDRIENQLKNLGNDF